MQKQRPPEIPMQRQIIRIAKPGRRIIGLSRIFFDQIIRCAGMQGDRLFRGITSDAPQDVTIVAFYCHGTSCDTYWFVAESREWSEAPEGAKLEEFAPHFTAHHEAEHAHAG